MLISKTFLHTPKASSKYNTVIYLFNWFVALKKGLPLRCAHILYCPVGLISILFNYLCVWISSQWTSVINCQETWWVFINIWVWCSWLFLFIYLYKERKRDRQTDWDRETERETERDRDREDLWFETCLREQRVPHEGMAVGTLQCNTHEEQVEPPAYLVKNDKD